MSSIDDAFANFVSRLDGVRVNGRGIVARCPAHPDSSPSLSVRRGDRGVMPHCFAGCTPQAITAAVGLSLRDLFPGGDGEWRREQDRVRRAMRSTPSATVRALLGDGLEKRRAELRKEHGYVPPMRAYELNRIRQRVGAICGVTLNPLPPFDWEVPPHDSDPSWPCLFRRQIEIVMFTKYGDPDGRPTRAELHLAGVLAARDLRDIERATSPT